MTTYHKVLKTPEQYADEFPSRGPGLLFQSRALRDAVAKVLTSRGVKFYRRTSHGSQLHPEYVSDYVGTIETGFGNLMYKTTFGRLYALEPAHASLS